MFSDNPIFTIILLTNPILILVGLVQLKYPPKEINSIYGYRTARAKRSQEAWDYAQPAGAKALIKTTLIFTPMMFLGQLIKIPFVLAVFVGLTFVLLEAFIPMILMERDLKEKFG
ncbi:MAG: SdpI family protein [Cyclobacteriaceae bacterium]